MIVLLYLSLVPSSLKVILHIFKTITFNKKNYKKKKFYFKFKEFKPFRKGKLYSKNYLLPNDSISILNKEYGKNWKIPDKKRQVFF